MGLVPLCLVSLAVCAAAAQMIATSEQTMRTTSSVDIQACVDGVLSDERAAMQQAVLSTLTAALATTAVYPTRVYTTSAGASCYLFVYQAVSPTAARGTGVILAALNKPPGPGLPVVYLNTQVQASLSVVPWQGEDPPLPPWNASAQDIIMWAEVVGGVLAVALLAACCFAMIQNSRERRWAQELMESDRASLQELLSSRGAGAYKQ